MWNEILRAPDDLEKVGRRFQERLMKDPGTVTATRTSCLVRKMSLLPWLDLHLNRPETRIIAQTVYSPIRLMCHYAQLEMYKLVHSRKGE